MAAKKKPETVAIRIGERAYLWDCPQCGAQSRHETSDLHIRIGTRCHRCGTRFLINFPPPSAKELPLPQPMTDEQRSQLEADIEANLHSQGEGYGVSEAGGADNYDIYMRLEGLERALARTMAFVTQKLNLPHGDGGDIDDY